MDLNLLRLKLERTNISLWAIYIVQIVLHSPYVNIKYFNQTISDIFSKIKSDPNFKNVNEVILAGNMSFKTDYIPNILKTDKIVPVFKTENLIDLQITDQLI